MVTVKAYFTGLCSNHICWGCQEISDWKLTWNIAINLLTMFNQTSEIHKARSKHLKKRKRGTKKCINSPGRSVIDSESLSLCLTSKLNLSHTVCFPMWCDNLNITGPIISHQQVLWDIMSAWSQHLQRKKKKKS